MDISSCFFFPSFFSGSTDERTSRLQLLCLCQKSPLRLKGMQLLVMLPFLTILSRVEDIKRLLHHGYLKSCHSSRWVISFPLTSFHSACWRVPLRDRSPLPLALWRLNQVSDSTSQGVTSLFSCTLCLSHFDHLTASNSRVGDVKSLRWLHTPECLSGP
jgi:hypothetical protein